MEEERHERGLQIQKGFQSIMPIKVGSKIWKKSLVFKISIVIFCPRDFTERLGQRYVENGEGNEA